jgi:DNA-binding CsgD family transcriptional regulator
VFVSTSLAGEAATGTVGARDAPLLLDRARERAALDALLDTARRGLSETLVLRGEPGIGKTALLERAVSSASDFRIVRALGIESEIELGFAGLHQLVVPFLPRLERLPAPQHQALGSAFGLITGGPPDRFLVGLATLTLLADAASDQPLLCVVDDTQWLDLESAQVLAFVARRLYADRIALLFAVREPSERRVPLAGLPELNIGGLANDDARKLLASVASGPLDGQVSQRILAETQGNPLAILELAKDDPFLTGSWILPNLVEAAVRSGNEGVALQALNRLIERARVSGTPVAFGFVARSRALLADDGEAESLYNESIDQLGQSSTKPELARSHLLFGEWLRRQGRRRDARDQLRTAYDMFASMGIEAFAERTRVELLATGERARKRTVATQVQLTPQERQIARLVRDGARNQEIAAQLFISPSTVQYHLVKVFRKLGVTSRTQLARVLAD